jgi:hypothetical protein
LGASFWFPAICRAAKAAEIYRMSGAEWGIAGVFPRPMEHY